MATFTMQYNFIAFGNVITTNPDVQVFAVRSLSEAKVIMRSVEIYGVLIHIDVVNASQLIREIRSDVTVSCLPIIAVGDNDAKLYNLGFDDTCITLDTLCLEKIATQYNRLRHLHQQANTDPLTGVWNRNAYLQYKGKINEASYIFLDLDHFKKVNDTYGHAAGDAVLTAFGGFLKRETRRDDFAARIGGEEFLVVLPNCPLPEAKKAAEQLYAAWPGKVTLPDGKEIPVTMSVGVGTTEEQADKAVYMSKANGRDQITAFGEAKVKRISPAVATIKTGVSGLKLLSALLRLPMRLILFLESLLGRAWELAMLVILYCIAAYVGDIYFHAHLPFYLEVIKLVKRWNII